MTGRILVTGGLGFIGAAFIRAAVDLGNEVIDVDAGTYAADPARIRGVAVNDHRLDIRSPELSGLIATLRPDTIVHFAAETHVTRSETDQERFFSTNVEGTRAVMEAALSGGVSRVVHVSTDEVYGPALDTPFKESDKPSGEGAATSPYARSKALADDLARSYSGDLQVIVVRPTNCFGPWQHPEKAIARWAVRALSGRSLPVWGDGQQIRDWMYVDDACSAIMLVTEHAETSDVFNIGPGRDARTNLSIAEAVAAAAGRSADVIYLSAYDRPQHDRRYSVDATKIRGLGWEAHVGIEEGIHRTVAWFAENRAWWEPLVDEAESLYNDAEARS